MDLNSKTWRQLPSPDPGSETLWPSPRFESSGTLAPAEYTRSGNAEFWIFGGQNGTSDFDELWVLDLETYQWTLEAGGEEHDGSGGNNGNIPAARSAMNTVSRWGGKLIVYGGSSMVASTTPIELADAWAYDFGGNGWELLNAGGDILSPGKRTDHISSVITVNGRDALVVYGGIREGFLLSDIWSLDLLMGVWSQLGWSPSIARMRHSVVTESNNIWSYGGFSQYSTGPNGIQPSITNRVITANFNDPNSNTWLQPTNTVDTVPGARYDHTANLWKGTMIIYGGRFLNQLKASNMWSMDIQRVQLEEVSPELETTTVPTFSLLHVLVALGIMICCMCIFMKTVRSRLSTQALASAGDENARNSSHFSGGLSNEEMLRLPPLKRFRTLDTEKGTYSMEIVNSLSPSMKRANDQSHEQQKSTDSPAGNTIYDDYGKCCAICIDNFGNGDIVRELPCKHEFHAGCVDEWLKTTPLCPMCKSSVREATAPPPSQNQIVEENGDGNGGTEENHSSETPTVDRDNTSPSEIELGQVGTTTATTTTTTPNTEGGGGLMNILATRFNFFSNNHTESTAVLPRHT